MRMLSTCYECGGCTNYEMSMVPVIDNKGNLYWPEQEDKCPRCELRQEMQDLVDDNERRLRIHYTKF